MIWLGALIGPHIDGRLVALAAVLVVVLSTVLRNRWLFVLGLVAIGLISGAAAAARHEGTLGATLPRGWGVVSGTAASDAIPYGVGYRFILEPTSWTPVANREPVPWRGPAIAIVTDDTVVAAGDRVAATGSLRVHPDWIRGDPIAGRMQAATVAVVDGPATVLIGAGNAVRNRVQSRLALLGGSPEAALLAGFLIGDTADLPKGDVEALRRAGLTHYVAVSGSNVALVLGAWWLVLGTTGAGNRTRAVTGLVVLAVFVVATRWESSVIRAAAMAGLVMGGRAVGVSVTAWGALGGAVAVLVAVSGDLAYDVGFQLSVAATGGVLLGMNVWAGRSPRVFWTLLAATVSAQLAVVPLLLLHFGTVPLLSPLANLAAAPAVTGATASAGVGVIVGWELPIRIAEVVAGVVLHIAATAAGWPQLDRLQVAALAIVVLATWSTPLRGAALGAIGVIVAVTMIPPGPPSVPTVVFLDVGQGDAVLLRDPSGAVALIDGGRDPKVLRERLRDHGVGRIDLLVATHGDADHVGGFSDLLHDIAVGRVWIPDYADEGDLLGAVIDDARGFGVSVDAVAAGDQALLGEFRIDVVGPMRRYASDNDGSVVLLVAAGNRSVLLPGDIGAVVQRTLGPIRPDVLMVPHHGAATTDLGWLEETAGSVAVISVGTNTYGHPAPEVVAVLEKAGAHVVTTWAEGDIAIALR